MRIQIQIGTPLMPATLPELGRLNPAQRLEYCGGARMSPTEEDALEKYVSLLAQRLGDALETVWLFGSAARGDMWSAHSQMHSDIDILVVTSLPLSEAAIDQLGSMTYPICLQCGRQISPAFKTIQEWQADKPSDFVERVRSEGHRVWPEPAAQVVRLVDPAGIQCRS